MTGAELRQWQRRCGLRTDAAAARAVGVSPGTFRRYCNGTSPIPPMLEILSSFIEDDLVVRLLDGLMLRHRKIPLAPAVSDKVIATLIKAGILTTNGGK